MIRYLLLALLGVVLVTSCQSTKSSTEGAVVTAPDEVPVDSFPSVPRKLPPMPPPQLPDAGETVQPMTPAPGQDGYWVQVFASHTSQGADIEAQRARSQQSDPVQVQYVNNLWKVRLGPYSDRQTALYARDNARSMGWADAWIVSPGSDVPFGTSYQPMNQAAPLPSSPSSAGGAGVYAVQVAASHFQEEGKQIMNNLISLGFNKVYLAQDGELWKVRVGTYSNRSECEDVKEQLRVIGFVDAFTVTEQR